MAAVKKTPEEIKKEQDDAIHLYIGAVENKIGYPVGVPGARQKADKAVSVAEKAMIAAFGKADATLRMLAIAGEVVLRRYNNG